MAVDSNSNSRVSTLTEQIVTQRKEDILTFSDNLNQISKVFIVAAEESRPLLIFCMFIQNQGTKTKDDLRKNYFTGKSSSFGDVAFGSTTLESNRRCPEQRTSWVIR